jgi:diadenosine tetraphosphate (Ap4A) HIT family hydrolase
MASSPCRICDQVAGRVSAPGGPIHDDGLWLVSHHTGPHTDPGELIVKLRRHCESLGQLTPAEAAALGPVLQAAVAAIERVVSPERTYVASYNESARHVHFFLLPRTRDLPAGHVVSDLYRKARMWLRLARLARNPSAEDRATAAGRIREDRAWSASNPRS